MAYDYDMLVIGGGAAGLTAAGISVSFGARTLLVEARKLGGDCTWYGCIPSKTLLHAAAAGLPFTAAMERVRALRQRVYEEADAPPVISSFGVEVLSGRARFVAPHAVEVDGRRITSRYFIIAAGSAAAQPALARPCLTNETLFELTEQPRSLAIIGAGPVGLEMAQAFAKLGTAVTVFGSGPRIAPRDDAELTALLQRSLERCGVTFRLNTRAGAAEVAGFDAVLAAAGRRSDVSPLNLAAAGVTAGEDGIPVDRHCRTNVRHIFASGDVTAGQRFTHMAEHTSKVAATNALLHWPLSIDEHGVPWCTFTDPELAHVGRGEEELRKAGIRYACYRFPFTKLDRAITDDATEGMIKVWARAWDGRIYGASIFGARAGDLIAEYALAIRHKIPLRGIADTIHPYPTYALGNRRAADQWYVQRQSPTLIRWVQRLFGYRGPVPKRPDPNRVV